LKLLPLWFPPFPRNFRSRYALTAGGDGAYTDQTLTCEECTVKFIWDGGRLCFTGGLLVAAQTVVQFAFS